MALNMVTITGADDNTDVDDLLSIWQQFQFVEWGILVGSATGRRFPSSKWIAQLVRAKRLHAPDMPLALHVCGLYLRDVARGGDLLRHDMGTDILAFNRVQLNWHGQAQEKSTSGLVLQSFCRMAGISWNPTLIFQFDGVNDELYRLAARAFICVGLFDRSHGTGAVPESWPAADPRIPSGWAGGLGPDNLAEELEKINAQSWGHMDYWVDMETKVRSDDDTRLDLDKVVDCLSIARDFMRRKAEIRANAGNEDTAE